jgi:hypothetical protein
MDGQSGQPLEEDIAASMVGPESERRSREALSEQAALGSDGEVFFLICALVG